MGPVILKANRTMTFTA